MIATDNGRVGSNRHSEWFRRCGPWFVAALVGALLMPSGLAAQVTDEPPPPVQVPEIQAELNPAPLNDLLREVESDEPDERAVQGRAEGQSATVTTGHSPATESAVFAALRWLDEHQLPDGGWSFDHAVCESCQGKCGNSGSLTDARNAATGLALLAYLGTGFTHQEGDCRTQIKAGLDYLIQHQKIQDQGGHFQESGGTMYSHGIATLAICEAYALSGDKDLRDPAQQAIDFIVFAQDPVGGGWRYMPRQAGDTSVSAWQLSALKSADLAGLRIPQDTLQRTARFLDSVQSGNGAGYGYTTPGDRLPTTAMGVLMRMYLDGNAKAAERKAAITRIAQVGLSESNMYFNYYAAQVLRQGANRKVWREWHVAMRDHLLTSQADEGHLAGSWYFGRGDFASDRGGRLYDTVLATLILEVYYRHLPIHRQEALRDGLIRSTESGDDP